MNISDKEKREEIELIARCCKQDSIAQKALYERFAPKMFSICIRYVSDINIAQDILHDGFITVFSKIGSLRNPDSLEWWMRKIFVNTSLLYLKANKKIVFSEEIETFANNTISESDTISQISAQELFRLISSMPTTYRTVFNMIVIEGYKYSEISKILNIPESTARTHLKRGKNWLRTRIKTLSQ